MLKNILVMLAFGWVLTASSCKKFLDQTPVSSTTTGNAYKTGDDIEAALTGAYNSFMSTNFYQWEIYAHTDVRSDNAYCGGSNDVDYYQLDMNSIPNTNGSVYRAWTELYAAIARANSVLVNIDNIKDESLTDVRRQQIIGEALFLRSFHYYQLVSLWGGVPLERYSNSAASKDINLPRATAEQTYTFIDSCLQVAVRNLPASYGADNVDKVRATKGAAYALLAKIWAQRPEKNYTKVSLYCDSVLLQGYSLVTNYTYLFDGNHNYNTESIMEIPYIANTSGVVNWGTEMLYPTHDNGQVPNDTWQRYCVPSRTLVNAFEKAGDLVRKNASVSFESAPWSDDYWNPCGASDIAVPFAFKAHNPSNWSGGDHTYLLRLADILLLKAEALAMLGDLEHSASYVNDVRSRVNLPDISGDSKLDMLTKILNERQLELAFEWQRWNDLIRYNVAVSTMNGLNETYYICNDDGSMKKGGAINYNFNDNKTLLPIPLTELQANPNLTQNKGY
ncbi:RagB/SusD family nutrient uptake outer membrane protein [Chitinophaga silvatica]|nr:RagB/SusD family nutrient uptake outer membrane protein [Chitinophaga silvatica]